METPGTCTPLSSISFIFMKFLGKIWPIIGWYIFYILMTGTFISEKRKYSQIPLTHLFDDQSKPTHRNTITGNLEALKTIAKFRYRSSPISRLRGFDGLVSTKVQNGQATSTSKRQSRQYGAAHTRLSSILISYSIANRILGSLLY